MRIHRVPLVLFALIILARPARAQWRADLTAVTFNRAGFAATNPHGHTARSAYPGQAAVRIQTAGEFAASPRRFTRILNDQGDLRLMFLGGLLGAAAGYLVGDAAHSGIASILDMRGMTASASSSSSYRDYLAALPAVTSALGAAMAAGTASCVKFLFGTFYRLDSCADTRWMILGALPGAALGYAFREEGAVAAAGAILLESAGAAIAGRFARDERQSDPTW